LAATQISISTIFNIGRAKRRRLEKFHLCSFFAGVNHERRLVFIWRFTLSVLLHSSVGNLFLRSTPAIFTSTRNCQTKCNLKIGSENRRVIVRERAKKVIVEDRKTGLYLFDFDFNLLKKWELNDFRLMDVSQNASFALIVFKEFIGNGNKERTEFIVLNLMNDEIIFENKDFLAYRGLFDSNGTKILIEHLSGLCTIDVIERKIIHRLKREYSIYNADLSYITNKIYIPTNKKSVLTYGFNLDEFSEIKLNKPGRTSWIKFNHKQNRILITDIKNSIHCFDSESIQDPIWSTSFKVYAPDDRIFCSPILATSSNLGCVYGFLPKSRGVYTGGSLFVFDLENGNVCNRIDYTKIGHKLITDYGDSRVLTEYFFSLSLPEGTLNPPLGIFQL
jgi:hypothetical protein